MSEHEQLRSGDEIKGLELADLKQHLQNITHLRDTLRRFFFDDLTAPKPAVAAPPDGTAVQKSRIMTKRQHC